MIAPLTMVNIKQTIGISPKSTRWGLILAWFSVYMCVSNLHTKTVIRHVDKWSIARSMNADLWETNDLEPIVMYQLLTSTGTESGTPCYFVLDYKRTSFFYQVYFSNIVLGTILKNQIIRNSFEGCLKLTWSMDLNPRYDPILILGLFARYPWLWVPWVP